MTANRIADKTPLPLTGGSNDRTPLVSTCIDWIETTFKKGTPYRTPEFFETQYVEHRPFNAYNVCSRFSDGRFVLNHTDRPEMGTHEILSGETLRNYAGRDKDILQFYVANGAVFTRLDLAVDIFNMPEFSPQRVTQEIADNKVKCRATEYRIAHDARNPGYTQYVGSKTAEIRLRIYDKAQEQGIEGNWVRVEAQYRAKRADTAAHMVARGVDNRAVIRGYFDCPEWPTWGKVINRKSEKVQTIRGETNTMKWLIEQVTPALAKEVFLHGDEVMEQFMNAYWVRLEELRNEKIVQGNQLTDYR